MNTVVKISAMGLVGRITTFSLSSKDDYDSIAYKSGAEAEE